MKHRVTIVLVLLVGSSKGCSTRHAQTVAIPVASSEGDWLAAQPVACGEVYGRIIDARRGEPLTAAYVDVDSARRGVSTDSLGHFRLAIAGDVSSGLPTRATTLRVRRIGFFELRVYLPPDLGYAVEVILAPRRFHVDNVSTVRIKNPGFCGRAS